jgi:isoquinoline 1-oxidoreductase subunit alpha
VRIELTVNGKPRIANADPAMPLLWVLRDILGLTGTKFGCGVAQCGACTVLVDAEPVRACVFPVGAVGASRITTIEGIGANGLSDVQQAWLAEQVPQCGYCQSGVILAVTALLQSNGSPSKAELDAAITNICACGTYPRIRKAVARVVAARASGEAVK